MAGEGMAAEPSPQPSGASLHWMRHHCLSQAATSQESHVSAGLLASLGHECVCCMGIGPMSHRASSLSPLSGSAGMWGRTKGWLSGKLARRSSQPGTGQSDR